MKNPENDLLTAWGRLASIVESSHDAIVNKDLNGIITSWNHGAEVLFGYTADEAIGQPVTMLMPPDRVDEEPGIRQRIRQREKIDHYETFRRHKDGSLVDISLTVSPIFNDQRIIIDASKIARDIAERKQDEADLSKLASIVESSSDAIISKDLNGVITSWNQGAESIFGYTAEEVIGRPVTILMPPDRVNEEPGIIKRIRQGEKVEHYETVRQRKDGSLVDISLNVSPVRDAHGVIIGASKIARDITARKRVERVSREIETAHKLLEAQEAERARIARDLHDNLGQQMTGLRLRLESVLEICGDDERLKREILTLRELALKMDRDIGFLSWELRPSELDTLGLKDALARFVKEWSSQYNITAHFHSDLKDIDKQPILSSQSVEINLYRILQESLHNVMKHAGATEVTVLLHRRNGEIVLVVEDNGAGMAAKKKARDKNSSRGLGLSGMRERAALIGGTLEIESGPSKGTTILVRIPDR